MKAFVINLPESVERREYMLAQCNKISFDIEVFDAVIGKKLTPEEVSIHTRPLSEITTPGELGCALSHISIYRKIVEDNIPYALIIEDDIVINENLSEIIKQISASIGTNEIILLNRAHQYFSKVVRTIPGHNIHPIAEANLTCSYVITRDAAQALLDFLYPVWLVADRWPFIRQHNITNINCLIPPVCVPGELAKNTTILGRRYSEEEIQALKLTWKKIKKARPMKVKLHEALWRLFVRRYYKVIKSGA